jgi:adenylate kinase family enzyme
MRKVLVIGSSGAGKSTFARRLGERTGLPVIHLDTLYWRAGWVATPPGEFDPAVDALLAHDRWIIDGNYSRTLERRLAACDTVIFLDPPRRVCLWRALKRQVRYLGRARPDMAPGCRERLTWEFVRWIWTYPRLRRPKILGMLREREGDREVVILRSSADVERFLARSGGGEDDGLPSAASRLNP